MTERRITLNDTGEEVLIKMAEGNPGGLTLMMKIMQFGGEIDPDGALGGFGAVLSFDTLGIYGSRIWMLYKDVCDSNLSLTLAVIRAHQLGYISQQDIDRAIDNYGEGLNLDDIKTKVSERLPNFNFDHALD